MRQFSQTFWVSTCVKTIIDEIASLDWDIVPKDEFEYEWVGEKIKAIKEFLLHPNKNGEGFSSHIIKAAVKDILEIDAGVIVKVFDINSYDFNEIEPKSGAPMLKPAGQRRMTELYARDGASFLKEIDKFGFEKGYWQYSYQIPAHPMWFNKEEIVYISEHPRSMSCYGYARTQAILDIIKSLHYSTLYNKRFFEETPIPDGALSLLDTNEAEITAFRTYWNNEFRAQPHKLAVINKDIKWQPFNVTNRELEFLATQKWYFNMVVSMFGLTPAELGVTEDVNRATSATQSELVKRKSIRPFLKLLEGFINNDILTELDNEGVEFQFIYDDPAEKKIRLENWKLELDMGVKTVNEVRNELGLEPVAGGDTNRQLQPQGFGAYPPPGGGSGGTLPEEESQAPGYKDDVGRAEAAGEKREPKEKAASEGYCDTCGEPFSTNRESTEYPGTCVQCVRQGRLGKASNRFGRNEPTFPCEMCGKLTRQTGTNTRLCPRCYDELERENEEMNKADTKRMPLKELVAEHTRLVATLRSGDKDKIKAEAEEQAKELADYKREMGEAEKEGTPFGKPGLGHSDKWWEVYHALIREGHSKESAARIANSKDV